MAQRARVACILSDDFEDSEFRVPYDRMRGEGFQVDVIAAKAGQEVKGKKGKEKVKADKGIADVRPEDYQALFIPGGYSPDHLRIDHRFVDFVKAFDQQHKTVAAVCHGPQLLMTAGIVRGRTLTAWPTIQDDLKMVGAKVKDEPVVVDDNWITSRKPDDLQQFSDAILKHLH
jgi:deglycase